MSASACDKAAQQVPECSREESVSGSVGEVIGVSGSGSGTLGELSGGKRASGRKSKLLAGGKQPARSGQSPHGKWPVSFLQLLSSCFLCSPTELEKPRSGDSSRWRRREACLFRWHIQPFAWGVALHQIFYALLALTKHFRDVSRDGDKLCWKL